MSYLDPPKSMLGPSSPRTSLRPRGSLARSSRMDFGADEFGSAAGSSSTPDRRRTLGGAPEAWSPWREKTPRASLVASPFAPASSSRSLARSQTLTNVREDASDVSMSSMRAGSGFGTFGGRSRLLPKSSSMRFDSVAEDDDAMSTVSDRNDVFAERAARRASLTPMSSRLSVLPAHSKPVAEPKMVYVPGRGFVKAAEASVPKPAPKNDADRILEALEASRQATSSLLPPNMVGASTRQLRKAIAVPLATSASASELKGHKAEWLSHGGGVSSAISPYGRRRAVDIQAREQRRELRAAESETDVSDMDVDGSARSMRSVASSRRRSTRSRSMMSISESEGGSDMSVSDARSPSPPRRSVRRSTRKGKSPAAEEETPKLRRSSRLRPIDEAASPSKPAPSPRSRRVKSPPADATPRASRRRKATTPPPETSPEPVATPAVPVIKETAPSPVASSSYRVRDDTAPRERSSLRAGPTRNRQHQGAASYTSSRATSPGTGAGTGGRFSAREEDLPDMDELEKLSKQSTANFSGFSMPSFPTFEKKAEAPKEPKENGQLSSRIAVAPQQPAAPLSLPASTGLKPLGGRIGSTRPRASSPLASSSFTAEPDSPQTKEKEAAKEPQAPPAPPAGGFFSLAGSAASTPGLTPPVAGGSSSDFFAPPKSPVKASGLGLGKPSTPPSGGIPNFFGSGTTTPTVPPPKAPVFDFSSGNIKPADTIKAPVKTLETDASPSPFSVSLLLTCRVQELTAQFGKSATPASGAETPKAGFSFGAPSASTDKPDTAPKAFDFATTTPKPAEASAATPKPFSFGAAAEKAAEKPADAPKAGFSFGAPSAPADKPAEAPKAPFSFGAPSAPAADKPAEAAKPPFSFGTPSAPPAAKPAEPAKAPFSFGAPSAPAADKPAEPKTGFSFGSNTSTPAPADKPAEAPKAPFSFGAPSAPAPAAATNGDKPGFSFGAQSSAPAAGSGFGNAGASGSTGFSFGAEKKADTPAAPAAPTPFSFGNTSAPAPSTGFGAPKTNGDAAKPFGFGNTSSTPAPSSGFNFGSNTAAPSTGFGSNTNSSAPTGFGAPVTSPTVSTGTAGGFGVTSPTTGFGTGSGFGSASSSAANSANKPSFSFGNSSAAPAAGGFGSTPAASTGFGSTPAPSTGFGAPAPAAGGFNFGSNSANTGSNSRPGSSSAAPFAFGATSGSSTPTTSAPSFQFGAPANTASTGNAPFQFGAPSSTPAPGFGSTPNTAPGSTFAFGAPAPAAGARFGSPAPGGAPADGFSMGIGETPGSPGGRKIKPLRRGAAKR
jgi:nucleoporin NUP1